jgi:hypothetical protein
MGEMSQMLQFTNVVVALLSVATCGFDQLGSASPLVLKATSPDRVSRDEEKDYKCRQECSVVNTIPPPDDRVAPANGSDHHRIFHKKRL